MGKSSFDKIYNEVTRFKIFGNGWGSPDTLLRIFEIWSYVAERKMTQLCAMSEVPVIEEVKGVKGTYSGKFNSPYNAKFGGLMDDNNAMARFILKEAKTYKKPYKPLVIHFAGTGDHNGWLRNRMLATPLQEDGISSLIHINPFYGERKPKEQKRARLNYVSDIFIMGGALIMEAQFLVNWAKKNGYYPVAFHGISLGGHMSNLAACMHPEPICNIPCLSWTTGSTSFTKGVFRKAVNWKMLEDQYHNQGIYKNVIKPKLPYYSLDTTTTTTTDTEYINTKLEKEDCKFIEISKEPVESSLQKLVNQRSLNTKEKFHDVVDEEVLEFFDNLMDYFTNLANFPPPEDCRLCTFVVAENDAYFPMEYMPHIHDIWGPECDVRIMKGHGHIGAVLRNWYYKTEFRQAIIETLNRRIQFYDNKDGPFEITQKKKLRKNSA